MKKFSINTQMVVLMATIVLWVVLTIMSGSREGNGFESTFFNTGNIQNIMKQMAIQGIIGVAAVLVILTGGIDLSIGSLVAVVNVLLALLLKRAGLSLPVAIAIVLAVSTLVGLFNGIMVYDLRLPAFIATLGMMTMLRGGAQLITGGKNISGLPRVLSTFARDSFIGIPNLFWILIIVVVVVEFILRKTSFGRYTYAIGSNKEAARLSGVNTRLVTYGVYMLASFLVGVAGCLETARLWQGSPSTGNMYELDAIAAAVLGGASLMGAEGNAIGAFIGALLMTSIYNGAVIVNLNPSWTRVIVGGILILTVAVDQLRKRRSGN